MSEKRDSVLAILLVDDDEDDYVIFERLLFDRRYPIDYSHSLRYQVDWVDNFSRAQEILLKREHDVCFIDHALGEENGLNLVRWAVQQGLDLPLIMLTGQRERQIEMEAARCGAADYLNKQDVNGMLVERSIRYAMEHKRTEKMLKQRTAEITVSNNLLTETNQRLEGVLDQLESERARLSTIIANAPGAIMVADENGDVHMANPAAAELFGPMNFGLFNPDEADTQIFYPDGRPYKLRDLPLKRSALDGETQVNLELRVRNPRGKMRWVLVNSAPILDRSGKITGAIALYQDITSRKLDEEKARDNALRIEVHRKLMEYREKERLFLAQELHDGPIQYLIATSFTLNEAVRLMNEPPGENRPDDKALAEKFQEMHKSLQYQINALRNFIGELRPPPALMFGLEKAMLSYSEGFKSRYSEINVRFSLHREQNKLSEEQRLAMFRIYQELLNNVARHANTNETYVRFRLNETHAVLEVEDRGSGFRAPQDWMEFVRQGHYGLAGIHERASAINGQVAITSSPGQGTLVQVTIPIALGGN
jgi:PAS domain S-box-containing protein